MTQRLHLVFGGELVDPTKTVFRNVDDIHIVGIFPRRVSAPTTSPASVSALPKHAWTRSCACRSTANPRWPPTSRSP